MSDTPELFRDSAENTAPRRGVREWLADLFSDEPENLPELVSILRDAAERQLIQLDALNIIFGALQVSDMHARDIMIPRSSLVVVAEDQTLEELLPVIVESRHSRFPVIGDNVDDIKGILHAKDLLPLLLPENQQTFAMRDCIRPALLIPESKRLNVLLQEFRTNRNHMALVVDEYGQISGAVTIEDVLEQIVGEIEDEHDVDDDSFVKQLEPNTFHVKANTTIEDFNEYFATEFSDEEFDTIGGLVLHQLGHLPERGECIVFAGMRFEVLNAESRRIRLLKVAKAQPDEADAQD
ncbi:MAG: HlyC/CorC family transporter [Candidatus Azotimanducaceae bacterium]|jgi:magnesium and cobalt transporter|tara:strand:- start:952 stop:1836 length:885 start_codon:yes stop_codon:yes gene_type:complete